MEPNNLPFSQNINVVQLIAAMAMVLTMFGINLDPKTQAAIVSLIVAGSAVITWILHTFINHPANQAKAALMVTNAVASVKNKSPLILAIFMVGVIGLGGCQAVNSLTPLQQLQAVESGFALAEATYDAICSVNSPPSFCTNPSDQANYVKAKAVLEAAFQTAQAAISAANGVDSSSIDGLLAAISQDWTAYNQIVNTVQAKDAARLGIAYHPIPL